MKGLRKKIISIVVMTILIGQVMFPMILGIEVNASSRTILFSRNYGKTENDNINVIVEEEENEKLTLILSGTGEMCDFDTNLQFTCTFERENRTITNRVSKEYSFNDVTKIVILNGITSIGKNAFSKYTQLSEVEIADTVLNIGDRAFYKCINLSNLELPETLNTLGLNVFSGCESLGNKTIDCGNIGNDISFKYILNSQTMLINGSGDIGYFAREQEKWGYSSVKRSDIKEVKFSNGIISIGDNMFESCSNLEKITLPNTLISIGENAFNSCTKLTNIEIPENVKTIGNDAFLNCFELRNVNFANANRITRLGEGAFFNCTVLESINISKNITRIEKWTFYQCRALSNVLIPGNVETIGEGAFENCTGLTNVTIENGIKTIEKDAFRGCRNLEKVVLPKSVTYLGTNAFYGEIECDTSVFTDGRIKAEWAEATKTLKISGTGNMDTIILWNSFKERIEIVNIGSGITDICLNAFSGCENLKEITIPETVTSISESAFYNCKNLLEISASKVQCIGEGAFYNCEKLRHVSLPVLKSISGWSFVNCKSLESIVIGNIDSVGSYAFNNCIALQGITIPNTAIKIYDNAFLGCENIENISIPANLREIGTDAFKDCINLKEIAVDENNNTYCDKDGILFNKTETKLIYYPDGKAETDNIYTIPSTVSEIGKNAFGSSGLRKIIIPSTVTIIGSGAFHSLQYLATIEVSDENPNYKIVNGVLTSKDDTEIIVCPRSKGITNYEIPQATKKIHEYAFYGCGAISRIKFNNATNLEEIGKYAFSNCLNLEEVEGKESLKITKISEGLFSECTKLKGNPIPDTTKIIENYAFYDCYYLGTKKNTEGSYVGSGINMPNTLTKIGVSAFYGCQSLTGVLINANCDSIENYAFENCTSLNHITVDEINENYSSEWNDNEYDTREYSHAGILYDKNHTRIIAYPAGKTNTKYLVPNTVKHIESKAFVNAKNLQSIIIPSSVETIGNNAFLGCDSIRIGCNYNSKACDYAYDNGIYCDMDDSSPFIRIETDGKDGNVAAEQRTMTIYVTDYGPAGPKDVRYIWTNEDTEPDLDTFKNNVENGKNITFTEGKGKYYLWVYSEDLLGNKSFEKNGPYNMNGTEIKPDDSQLQVTVDYSTKDPTNQNVIVTINANKELKNIEGWTLSEDKMKLTKEYTQNIEENVVVSDTENETITIQVKIANIDKGELKVINKIVTRENNQIKVTLKFNKKIEAPEGWTLSEDGTEITRFYTENTKETLTIKDLSGNELVYELDTMPTEIENGKGDINQDGETGSDDVVMLKRHILATLSGTKEEWLLTGDKFDLADMDKDGKINVTDLIMIKREILKKINS